jgi:tRNA threonylcarbamoyladenosine biosynthesis protein TsaB
MTMIILAVETSSQPGSIALLNGNTLLYEKSLEPGKHTTQTLIPEVRRALDRVGSTPRDIELLATTTGPGSFTGLRISVTIAKALAYATGAAVIGLNTLEVIAHQGATVDGKLAVLIDAQRGEFFSATFRVTGGQVVPEEPTRIVDRKTWLDERRHGETVCGTGLARIAEDIPHLRVVNRELWQPRASTVGRLAWTAFQSGRRDDPWTLTPNYFRLSAAEEWKARHSTSQIRTASLPERRLPD